MKGASLCCFIFIWGKHKSHLVPTSRLSFFPSIAVKASSPISKDLSSSWEVVGSCNQPPPLPTGPSLKLPIPYLHHTLTSPTHPQPHPSRKRKAPISWDFDTGNDCLLPAEVKPVAPVWASLHGHSGIITQGHFWTTLWIISPFLDTIIIPIYRWRNWGTERWR